MKKKIRVNITLDKENLEKAKKKIRFFGGKLSTLFDAFLKDFVDSRNRDLEINNRHIETKIVEIEKRLNKLESVITKKQKHGPEGI